MHLKNILASAAAIAMTAFTLAPSARAQTFINTGEVTGDSNVGGIFGKVESKPSVTDFSWAPNFDHQAIASSYVVASSDVATSIKFTAHTTGANLGPAQWSVSPAGISVSGDSATSGTNVGTVTIPAGATGTYTLTLKDFLGGNTKTVTLHVNGLQATVNSLTAPSGKFVAGNKMWRVLSKTMGTTGHGSGNRVLILSEHILMSAPWHSTADQTAYASSAIRTTLKNLYDTDLQWSKSYAFKPVTSGADWTSGTFNSSLATRLDAKVGSDTFDACFLLSYADMTHSGLGFDFQPATQDANRIAYAITAPGAGTARNYWMRSSDAAMARYVSVAGSANGGFSKISPDLGVRPAMILGF